MTLDEQARQILNNFENTTSRIFLETLQKIMPLLKNELTRDYLLKKIDVIKKTSSETEKMAFCKSLLPYIDWYVQGL